MKITSKFQPGLTRLSRQPQTWWVMLAAWWVTSFAASSFTVAVPSPSGVEIPHLDKVMHFGWFAVGGLLLGLAVRLRRPPPATIWLRMVLPILAISMLGALDEFRQSFTPGRSGNDVGDWLADTLGGAFGVCAARWLRRFFHARH